MVSTTAAPPPPPPPPPPPVMTAEWLARLASLTQQVALLTSEQAAWSTATTLQIRQVVPLGNGYRIYSGPLVRGVIADLLAATNTDLAAAQLALTNCMAGR